jgi:hypothetical protein
MGRSRQLTRLLGSPLRGDLARRRDAPLLFFRHLVSVKLDQERVEVNDFLARLLGLLQYAARSRSCAA